MPLYYCDFQLPVLAYIFGATIWVDKSKRLGERERERLQYLGKEGSPLGNIDIEIQSSDLPQVSTNLFCSLKCSFLRFYVLELF
jgi:hypothetical protein